MAAEIFTALSNLRMILDTETDADSPNSETLMDAIRYGLECLLLLAFGTGDSGSATEDPPNDSTGVLTDSGAAYDADEHNGRTLVMTSGAAKGNTYTIDDTTATTIVCTGDNLYSDGVRSGDDYLVLYDLKVNADGHDHDGVNSSIPVLGDASIARGKLKSSQGSVSTASTTGSNQTLPGGEYGFYPQLKTDNAAAAAYWGWDANGSAGKEAGANSGTTAVSALYLAVSAAPYTAYAYQRYLTASGEVFWIFIKRDKATKKIISTYEAPDHPCFGNGGDPEALPHPFLDFRPETEEILVLNPNLELVREIYRTRPKYHTILEGLMERYGLDEQAEPPWPDREITVDMANADWPFNAGEKVEIVKRKIAKPANIRTVGLKPAPFRA